MDYTRSRAVLMGTWTYDDANLPDIPAARNSFQRMRTLLTSPACGWPASSITVLENCRAEDGLGDVLLGDFEQAEDVALFYFVGHGLVSDDDHLCLGVGRTLDKRRRTTSLLYDTVRYALLSSPARVKIAIIDCCYSGIATRSGSSLGAEADGLDELTMVGGVITIAASNPFKQAYAEPDDVDGGRPQTYFTKYFADVIENGLPDQPAQLRLHQIFGAVRERLERARKPAPTMRNSNTAAEFAFARNTAPADSQRDLERELSDLRASYERLREELKRTTEQPADPGLASEAERAAPQPGPAEVVDGKAAAVRERAREIVEEMKATDGRIRRTERDLRERHWPDVAEPPSTPPLFDSWLLPRKIIVWTFILAFAGAVVYLASIA